MLAFGVQGPFVGRQRELAILLDRLEDAAFGKGGVVLIGGEPGVGKTRLVRELAAQASAQQRQVLVGRAYDLDIMPPYLPIAEALADHVRTAPEAELRDVLADGAADVALIVPAVRNRLPDVAPRPAVEADEDRFQFFERVSTFVTNIARAAPGGLLLIVDDLHWADQATLQLAVHLARKLAGSPLLLVATYRTIDLQRGASVQQALADLSREGLAEHLEEAISCTSPNRRSMTSPSAQLRASSITRLASPALTGVRTAEGLAASWRALSIAEERH